MKLPIKKVVCAVILQNQKILLAQRNSTSDLENKWEFPGGKIIPNETAEQALHREIKEELNMTITIQNPLKIVAHVYPEFEIELIPFLCASIEQPELRVHKTTHWVAINDIMKYDLAEADVPVCREIQELFK
jgi:8-oxo-dGTP diphosphatase